MDVSEILKDVVEKESQLKTTIVTKPIDVDLDVGNLTVFDTNPIEDKIVKKKWVLRPWQWHINSLSVCNYCNVSYTVSVSVAVSVIISLKYYYIYTTTIIYYY